MPLRAAGLATLFALSLSLSGPALSEGASIIVLDGSGSMWGQIEGRAKLEIAREALAGVLQGVDPAAELGLMAYGHREKGSCGDIELIVPPGPGTAAAIAEAAAGMKFLGKTPLTEAVRQAAAALRATEAKATVILITDGIETCDADPCALGRELAETGVDFTTHVVGFGLTAEEGRTVACLAENTGGRYIEAGDAAALSQALQTTVAVVEPAPDPAPEPEPEPEPAPKVVANFDPVLLLAEGQDEGEEVQGAYFDLRPLGADGMPGEVAGTTHGFGTDQYPPGDYRVEARLGEATASADVTLTDDAVARPVMILNAGIIGLNLFIKEGEAAPGAYFEFAAPSGEVLAYGYGSGSFILPAGDYAINTQLGTAKASEPLTLAAGERMTREIVLGTGLAVVEAFYAEGVQVEGGDHFVQIFPAKANLDGSRNDIAYTYGAGAQFDLPPGDYVARATLGEAVAESPFTIKPGERSDIVVLLNAGVAAITAPGAEGIRFETAKPDINGKRKEMGYTFGEAYQTTLPAGDYVAIVRRAEATSETPFTVRPGERTEVTSTP
ncbi:MAG: VWA domain-containing protein [Paracoccaceae bacterium]